MSFVFTRITTDSSYMKEYEKMKTGQRFEGADPEINAGRANAFSRLNEINSAKSHAIAQNKLTALLNHVGEHSIINPPFYCEFGRQISIGHNSLINIGVTMLDGAPITIGDHVMIGPSVQLYTATHPIDFKSRREWETYCLPIIIEDDVWIGGNAVINQGVTIGARSIVAANAVVNHDVPPDSMVGGTPAKLIKKLNT